MLLAVLNTAAGVAFGDECRLTKAEQIMIEEPLQRILERLDVQAAGMVGAYMDPIVLFLGLLGWGSRVWRIKFQSDDDQDGGTSDDEPEKPLPPPRQERSSRDDGKGPEEESEPLLTGELIPAELRDQIPGHA